MYIYTSIYLSRKAYGQSKLAQLLHSNHLSKYLLSHYKWKNITTNVVHPGVIRTNIGRNLHDPAKSALSNYIEALLFSGINIVGMDEDTGALTQLVVGSSPAFNHITGKKGTKESYSYS